MKLKRRIQTPEIAITQNEYEGKALQEGLNLLPIDSAIKPNDTVTITPNWVKGEMPETGTVVGQETLRELIKFTKGKNPKRLVVACGSGGEETLAVMEKVGYKEIIDSEGVEFVDLNHGPFTTISLDSEKVPETEVNTLYNETDFLISFSQIKVHQEATVTLGIKNIALSWPPAEIHGFPKKDRGIHTDLHEFISAMARKFTIDLTILSSDKGMIGLGPSGGKPVDAGVIISGTDPVSADVAGARLLGFLPQAVHYLFNLIGRGYGEGDLNKVNFYGLPLDEAEKMFSQAGYGKEMVVDDGQLAPMQQ